jgi:hypothetical protein
MAYFAGLDVSVKETSVCIVDDASKIVREVRVASEPEALYHAVRACSMGVWAGGGAKAAAAPAGGFGGGSGAADTSNTDPLGPRHHNTRC